MPRPELNLQIVSTDEIQIGKPQRGSGWGELSQEFFCKGRIVQMVIDKDGQSKVGFHILEDGSIIITDYGNMCFTFELSKNLTLKAERPWKK